MQPDARSICSMSVRGGAFPGIVQRIGRIMSGCGRDTAAKSRVAKYDGATFRFFKRDDLGGMLQTRMYFLEAPHMRLAHLARLGHFELANFGPELAQVEALGLFAQGSQLLVVHALLHDQSSASPRHRDRTRNN